MCKVTINYKCNNCGNIWDHSVNCKCHNRSNESLRNALWKTVENRLGEKLTDGDIFRNNLTDEEIQRRKEIIELFKKCDYSNSIKNVFVEF